jgi:hypothetical protein
MTDQTESPFSEEERRALTVLAAMIVPASEEFGVPGADDPAIVDNILEDASRRPEQLSAALTILEELSRQAHSAAYPDLPDEQRDSVTAAYRETHKGHANLVANLTVQGYYRDDRVVASIGLDARPPHPLGYEVEQGDWSLLNPVREKEAFYRPIE